MRIAFFVYYFPKLSETFVLNQITGLIDRGHDVDIYAYQSASESKVHRLVNEYKLLEKTYYYGSIHKNISSRIDKLRAIPHILATGFRRNPVKMSQLLFTFRLPFIPQNIFLWSKLAPIMGNRRYDIIHCHFGTNGKFAICLRELGLVEGPILTVFHGVDLSAYIKKYGVSAYKDLFTKGDLFLPISNYWKDALIGLGCNPKKIVVHRMGVDTAKFKFSAKIPESDGTVRILTVARLVEKKGIEYAIKALAKVISSSSKVKYEIVGDGPLKADLKRLVKELGLEQNIDFLGWRTQEELIQLMQDCHIFLAPSVTSREGDKEGIPVVLMEALANGLPVVSTYHGGIPELVKHGHSGYLVPERDVNALAEKLEYLFNHPAIWAEMGLAGRKYVEANYDIESLTDQLINLYQMIIGHKDNGHVRQSIPASTKGH